MLGVVKFRVGGEVVDTWGMGGNLLVNRYGIEGNWLVAIGVGGHRLLLLLMIVYGCC